MMQKAQHKSSIVRNFQRIDKEFQRKRKTPKQKYRNPEDPAQTWSGRGQKPSWIKEALGAGVPLEDLLIAD